MSPPGPSLDELLGKEPPKRSSRPASGKPARTPSARKPPIKARTSTSRSAPHGSTARKPLSSRGRHKLQTTSPGPGRTSMWDQDIPTLLTMPILCAILAFLMALASNGLLNWYSLNHTWHVNETNEEGKTQVNYYLNRERVRYYRNDAFEREENNAISTDNQTGAFFVGDDPYKVVPMFNLVRYLSIGVVFATMATAVLTIFTQRGMIPYDTKQITTICSLLAVALSFAAGGIFALQTPGSLQKHLEAKASAYNMHRGDSFPRPFFGSINENDVQTFDPYNNMSITEDRKLTYYPGPSWFLMVSFIPGLAYATYHFQSRANAGEEQSIANFVGQTKARRKGQTRVGRTKPAGKGGPGPAPGLSLNELQKSGAPLGGRRADLEAGAAHEPRPGRAPTGRASSATSTGRQAHRPRSGESAAAGPLKGGTKGMDPATERKYQELVEQYRKFTGKDRLTTNELARLRDMARKK